MIRIALVDDQTLVRQGIRSLLELTSEVAVVAEAADGIEAVSVVEQHEPDILLLDLRMPRMDGIGVLEVLRERRLMLPVLILTTFDDDELLQRALEAGARGYLLKDVSLEHLVEAICRLNEGKTLVQPVLTERIARGIRADRPAAAEEDQVDALTEREVEVLRLMAGGYSNKEIARALDLSVGTVKNYVSNILAKLGVRDRTRAVLRAIDGGII